MTIHEQAKKFEGFIEQQRKVLLSKGNDYAGEDRLHNFKAAGMAAGLTPDQNCLSLIATKVARLGNLLKEEVVVENESITDSILDLANYAFLLHCIITENQPMEVQTLLPFERT